MFRIFRAPMLLLLVICCIVAGCRGGAREPAGAGGFSPDEMRALCLDDPDGGLPIDDTIREHQRLARQLSGKPDEWTLIGRGWVRKARRSGDAGFYVNADACASAALERAPGDTAALGLRALAQMNTHAFDDARSTAEIILKQDLKDPVALGVLSDALLELGRFEDAAAAVQRMVDLRPDMASYARAAYMRWLQGDTRQAKAFIRSALAGRDGRDPEPAAWTFVQAATLFWNEGDYDGADAVFAEALRWLPEYPPALVGRARVALSRRQPQTAIALLEKAYRVSPLADTAWLLADAREMAGDRAGARRGHALVVRDGQHDKLTLASFYATKNRAPEEALRLIDAERRTRGGIYVDDVHAWALFRAGRLREARDIADRAIRMGTPDARLLYHAGAIRLASGDRDGLALVRRALALNPRFDSTGADEAERLLRRADGN
jgi:tetratricopeptide (TPR) repeat protein